MRLLATNVSEVQASVESKVYMNRKCNDENIADYFVLENSSAIAILWLRNLATGSIECASAYDLRISPVSLQSS